ncbi:MAG TPA: polysaccharide biosynthesis tyrosine autokinase [Pyrinomonadaceae bacterium]|nr:polysaccharide biosynthesis tyrosine autokinase [Pyrinomonadaceae bacterium]
MKESRELVNRVRDVNDLEVAGETGQPAPPIYRGYDLAAEEEVHLLDYWRSVRKRLWLVISITVLMTTLAAIYMARKPDIYAAQARVQVDLENINPALGTNRGGVNINYRISDPAYFNTQLQILSSPGLLRRVVKTLDLEHNQAFMHPQSQNTRSTWQNILKIVGLGASSNSEQNQQATQDIPLTTNVASAVASEDLVEAKRLQPYVALLQAGLKIDPVKETRLLIKETRLIDISYTHQDPQIAAKIINALADTFVLANEEKRNENNNTTGGYMQKRIAELQTEIRADEERLINYANQHAILSLDAGQNTVVERLAGLNRQLLEAENQRKLAQAAYEASLQPGAAEARADDTNKQIQQYESSLVELRKKRAELLVDNTEEWPEVQQINKQIEVLERQLQESRTHAASTVTTNLKTNYMQAKATEDSLRDAFNKQRAETLVQNEAAVNYNIIKQGIETNKQLLDGLLQRSRENDVMGEGTPNNIHVVDYSLVPEGPIGPNRTRIVLLALILSFGFGVGFALFLDYLDDTVRSADDVEKILRLPALGVIPSIEGRARRKLLPTAGSLQIRNGKGGGNQSLLIFNTDNRSALAEAYRQLRTSVLLSTAGRAPKSLLVTSSQPAEGKTTTATNIAISLAQTGASVLIIDADMRRPRLHSIFETVNGKGLSTYLSSEMSDAELLDMVEQHEPSGLHYLTSGPVPPNPAELLGSEQMRKLLSCIEKSFTHVIIDSPPIASFTDGVLISTIVDGVLLVVHGGKSSRHVVRRARQVLQDVGAKIFGVVLNNVNISSHDHYYYQRYYQQSYYDSDSEVASEVQG